jgi:hypothetical protein
MSERNPTYQYIAGSGTPRLIVEKAGDSIYESVESTTYTATSMTEAEGSPVNITSSSVANPTVITTPGDHGLITGDWIRIASHTGSTPDINGIYQIIDVPTSKTFTINVHVTVGGTGGTVRRTAAFIDRGLTAGMRVFVDTGTLVTFAKILSIDVSNITAPIIIVDEWTNGTPTNGDDFVVDGYIVDLPRCYELTEYFAPHQITHNLFRGRKSNKFFGWDYRCTLDYSRFISADMLLSMIQPLNISEDDRIVLIPRADAPENQFNVYFNAEFSISIFGISPGHRKPVFSFDGMELVQFPRPVSGYGYGYAGNYGNEL